MVGNYFLPCPLGSRSGQVIGDHIPPTKMVEDIKAQRRVVEASLGNFPDLIKQIRYVSPWLRTGPGTANS